MVDVARRGAAASCCDRCAVRELCRLLARSAAGRVSIMVVCIVAEVEGSTKAARWRGGCDEGLETNVEEE